MVSFTSTSSFIVEIALILLGLSGLSVVGVNVAYFRSLPLLFFALGLAVGVLSAVSCIIGIYVLLLRHYRLLKVFTIFLGGFLLLQLAFIAHLYVFVTNINTDERQQASLIALDVSFALTACSLLALVVHLKQQISNIEMAKL